MSLQQRHCESAILLIILTSFTKAVPSISITRGVKAYCVLLQDVPAQISGLTALGEHYKLMNLFFFTYLYHAVAFTSVEKR
jgi:hypothetical protein